MNKLVVFFLSLLLSVSSINAQHPPFWNDIAAFKKQDSISFPATKQILFIGSSSFTLWKDVQSYFPKKKILNRAFGGSTLVDVTRFRYEAIYPYAPKQIVMYCGENDFASSDTVTVSLVVERFKNLFRLIRQKYPTTPFAYVSMKPSPSRAHLMEKYKEGNDQIKQYLSTQKNTRFVNVFDAMLDANGKPLEDIFREDRLHMNAKGYKIWQRLMKSYLL